MKNKKTKTKANHRETSPLIVCVCVLCALSLLAPISDSKYMLIRDII